MTPNLIKKASTMIRDLLKNLYGIVYTLNLRKNLKKLIPLNQIKANKNLSSMMVVKKGSRLSVQPVSLSEYNTILKMAQLN